MKNINGLLIAIALGMAGALLNWFYLDQRSRDVEKVEFIGVREGVTIRPGDPIREDQLAKVDIPRNAIGQLQNFAYYWKDLATIVGQSPKRAYTGGELLLRQDLKTPPPELSLNEPGTLAISIPIDTTLVVTQHITPGRRVSFLVPRPQFVGLPTPADTSGVPTNPAERGGTEIIGPFKVLAVGNRLGSVDVMKATHMAQVQENVITIAVKVEGDQLEPKARKLWESLRQANFRQVGVLLYPRGEDEQ